MIPATSVIGVARWTRRAHVLLGIGGALAVLAVLLRTPVPIFLGLPLLAAPFAAAWTTPRQIGSVAVAWEAGGSGRDVDVRGAVSGPLGAAALDLEVRLHPPVGSRAAGPVDYERTEQEVRFSTRWRLDGPTVTAVRPPEVVWRDPTGLSERILGGARTGLALERYPSGLRGLGLLRLERTIALPGESRSRRIGPAGEFFGLRDAGPNEPMRQINWAASARVGRLLANDYLLDRSGDLVIVLDLRPTPLGRRSDERLLRLARAASYGIAEELLRGKTRLGFATFGEFVEAFPLSTGRTHRARILRAIAACRVAEVAGPSPRCAVGLGRYYRPGTTALVISSCAGDPGTDLAPHVRHRGFPVVQLSPSPVPFAEESDPLDPADEPLARTIEAMRRRQRLAPLWTYGPVIDWSDYWSLGHLTRYLRQPVRGRRG